MEGEFKFNFLNSEGQSHGGKKRGILTDEGITLDSVMIEYKYIADTVSREHRLHLRLYDDFSYNEEFRKYINRGGALLLQVSKIKALDLEKQIDKKSSKVLAAMHRELLEKEGKGSEYRAIICNNCEATVNLTNYEKSEYIYCRYCESILNKDLEIIANGDNFSICSECQLFDFISKYTVFQFYFLLVVYGFSTKYYHVCPVDGAKLARGSFWKNLVFILGVPSAVVMWLKAKKNQKRHVGNLSRANEFSRNGNLPRANDLYDEMLLEQSNHPAILLNKAKVNFEVGNNRVGVDVLNKSLDVCSNYIPSIRIVQAIQNAQSSKIPDEHKIDY